MVILLIGSGAREHALAQTICKSPLNVSLICIGTNWNPGIQELAQSYTVDTITDKQAVLGFASSGSAELAIIGPEAPLAAGIADALWSAGIPTVGPTKDLAQIETSKGFTRNLLSRYSIPANPRYRFFNTLDGIPEFLEELGDHYVVKYDGLMGGKGVKVSGDHLHSHAEALDYCIELVDRKGSLVIEERLEGQEFSLMSLCDGTHLAHMPPVQDHKRAYVGDQGPNTGGMGSYSDADLRLPFLTESDLLQAQEINRLTAQALKDEFGKGYQGVLYGGFMATRRGIRLVEYNARFGDPEALNVLPLLESDFVSICRALVGGTLDQEPVSFSQQATVCKYAVPEGYPDHPIKGQPIDVSAVQNKESLYYASVDTRDGELVEAGSRTVAFVGIADTLKEAEILAETEIGKIRGPLFHREDIGTAELIRKRVEEMERVRGSNRT